MSSDVTQTEPDETAIILSEAQHEHLKAWVASVREIFALGGWHLEISRACAVQGATAQTFVRDETDRATIYLSKTWLGFDEQNRRVTLAHELLHPPIYRVTGLFRALLEREIGQTGERVVLEAVRLAEEQAIDRLAMGIAPLLPPLELPDS